MSIMQHWQEQRTSLQAALADQSETQEAIHHVRHALMQTEQNALAEIGDDLLRQQASVLMNSLKGSLAFLETFTAGPVWVAQKPQKSVVTARQLWIYAMSAAACLLIWCYLKSQWIALAFGAAALSLMVFAFFKDRKNASSLLHREEVKVSVRIDKERMLSVLDLQLRAMDRYLSDFGYLNDQARGNAESADPIILSRAADLMESLYDWEEGERQPAEEAARNLLARLGLQAVDYSEESRRLFNTLPTKNTSRTLSPAIISSQDQRLLRRGTAAVSIDAA